MSTTFSGTATVVKQSFSYSETQDYLQVENKNDAPINVSFTNEDGGITKLTAGPRQTSEFDVKLTEMDIYTDAGSADFTITIESTIADNADLSSQLEKFSEDINASTYEDGYDYTLEGTANAITGNYWGNIYSIENNSYLSAFEIYAVTSGESLIDTKLKLAIISDDLIVQSITEFDIDVTDSIDVYAFNGLNIFVPANANVFFWIESSDCNLLYLSGGSAVGDTIARVSNASTINIGDAVTYAQEITNYRVRASVTLEYTYLVTEVSTGMANYLYGKKVVAVGNSMVKGHTLSDEQTWLHKIADRNNMEYVNEGINGAWLTDNGADSVYERMTDSENANYIDEADVDYLLFFIGTNDANNGVTIGDETSTDATEIYGALKAVLEEAQTRYPTTKIGFITPYRRNTSYPDYIEALVNGCKLYGVPVFNNLENGGISWDNSAQVTALTLGDTYHLNEDGMEFASYKYEHFMRGL